MESNGNSLYVGELILNRFIYSTLDHKRFICNDTGIFTVLFIEWLYFHFSQCHFGVQTFIQWVSIFLYILKKTNCQYNENCMYLYLLAWFPDSDSFQYALTNSADRFPGSRNVSQWNKFPDNIFVLYYCIFDSVSPH